MVDALFIMSSGACARGPEAIIFEDRRGDTNACVVLASVARAAMMAMVMREVILFPLEMSRCSAVKASRREVEEEGFLFGGLRWS
jgi:hypothetical protein